MNERKFKSLKYSISDEINSDISYIRGTDNGQYFTGLELCLLLVSGVISCFLIPFAKSFSKKLGENMADELIKTLNKHKLAINNKNIETAEKVDKDLYLIFSKLSNIKQQESNIENINNIVALCEANLIDFFVNNGFPNYKAKELSQKTIELILKNF